MSPPTKLPARASLEYLRKESKALQRVFSAGDPDAVARVRRSLPRAGQAPADQVPKLDLSLQEAQHVLACEYGFRDWKELLGEVNGPRLEDLARLSRRDAEVLMREADQLDALRALAQAPEAARDHLLSSVSDRVRGFYTSELEFLDRSDRGSMDAARERFMGELRALIEQGQATWPPKGDPVPERQRPAPELGSRFEALRQPLHQLAVEELTDVLAGLADLAVREGVLALDAIAAAALPSLLTEGITLIMDGTEPELVEDLLTTRAGTILRNRTVHGHMATEGWMSIHSGDNPAIVRRKIETYFLESPSGDLLERREPDVSELARCVQGRPLSQMTDPEWAELYCDLGFVARQRGIVELEPLVEVVDDVVLAAGMRATLVDRAHHDVVLTAMTDRLQELRLEWHRIHSLVIGGVLAIQQGKRPEGTVAEAQALAAERVEQLAASGLPRQTA